jgi:acyl carrier protein
MKNLEQRVTRLLGRSAMVPEQSVRPDMALEELGMGSLEQIECVMALEEELHVELPLADLRQLRTVQDVIDVVQQASNDARAV